MPKKVAIDKSRADTAAVESYNAAHKTEGNAGAEIRQIKYPNNIFEQDYRVLKRPTRAMPGFKSF